MKNRYHKEKEIKKIEKKEEQLRKKAHAKELVPWKRSLEAKIPQSVIENLERGFYYAFALIFEKGVSIIEKTYDKVELQREYDIHNYAIQVKGGRKEFGNLHKAAASSKRKNLLLTTAEGIGLGVLGIGLPDIVLFVGMLLKGIYEYALNYGFDYEDPLERMWILKMMEAAVSRSDEWDRCNERVDLSWKNKLHVQPTKEMLQVQMKKTAKAFAADMIVTKFVQGIPVVGILGGAQNPVYYDKVMRYVQVKYQKRYLMKTE